MLRKVTLISSTFFQVETTAMSILSPTILIQIWHL